MVPVGVCDLTFPLFDGDEEPGFIVNIHLTVSCDGLTTTFALTYRLGIQELANGVPNRLLDELAQGTIILAIERDVLKLRGEASPMEAVLSDW